MPVVARPPAVSEDTVEASATAMEDEDEDERPRSLPGDDEDDDMGEDDLEELFGRGARAGAEGDPIDLDAAEGAGTALTCHRAWRHVTARFSPDRAVPGLLSQHGGTSGTARQATVSLSAVPCQAVPDRACARAGPGGPVGQLYCCLRPCFFAHSGTEA